MRISLLSRVLFLIFASTLFTVPVVAAADEPAATQVITVTDTRSGDGPCGFQVQRDLNGTVSLVTGVDAFGNLIITVEAVTMTGSLTNPENDQSVDIRWIHRNGDVSFAANGTSVDLMIGLSADYNRGYETADSRLAMELPQDGAEVVVFTSGEPAADPWANVCGLLA
jgi:hypothetical protein